MSRLVLHVGTHKTGTTAIQGVLDRVAPLVREATGLQWVPLARRRVPPVDHREDQPEIFRTRGAVARAAWLDHLAEHGDAVLAVEESLSWVFDPVEVERLVDGLESRFDDIDVVAYVRRQDRHLVSHFQQSSHTVHPSTIFYGPRPAALPVHRPHHDRYLDHASRLDPWLRRLGRERLHVRAYDPARLAGGDVVRDFLDWLGVDPDRLPPDVATVRNRSIGKTVTKLGQLSNLLPDRRVWSARLADQVPADPPMRPARTDAASVLARHRRSNARLAEGTGHGEPFFDDDLGGWDEVGNEAWVPREVVVAIDGIRGHTRWMSQRPRRPDDPTGVAGPAGRDLRARARAGRLPPEDEVNRVLLAVLARMNAFAAGHPDWRHAPAPGA